MHVSGPSNGAQVGQPRLPEHQLQGARERAICLSEKASNTEGIKPALGTQFLAEKPLLTEGPGLLVKGYPITGPCLALVAQLNCTCPNVC